MRGPARSAVRAAGLAGAVTVAVALVAAGCSGDSDEPSGAPSTSPTAPAEQTQVSWGKVTGRLPQPARERVAATVTDLVDGWTTAAYLGGDYPRSAFTDAWPGFIPGAQQQARRDRDLMSNADIGARIDGVDLRRSTVRIDAPAVKQRPVGVTAHVALTFRTTGDLARDVRVRGRLYLTPTDHGWKVFAYDVTKGVV